MAKAFERLFHVGRRRPEPSPSPAVPPTDDEATLGPPPVLLPAAIFRQVLFDPNELNPVWARPRQTPAPSPAPEPAADPPQAAETAVADPPPPAASAPAKRPRKPKAPGTPAKPRTRSTRRT